MQKEHQEKRYGPYTPVGGPIPLHRYRSFKKTKNSKRAERIEKLAQQLGLPAEAISKNTERYFWGSNTTSETVLIPFQDPDPFQEFTYPTVLAAKRAIADYLHKPLAKLNNWTLDKKNLVSVIATITEKGKQEGLSSAI